jgi:phage major head subunit gpT-like protein
MVIRGQFSDFYLSTMLPALNAIIRNRYNQYREQYSQIFRVESSDRSIEQFGDISGVSLFGALSEGEPVRYDDPVQGFNSTFTHGRFGLGVQFSQDTIEDDKHGLVAQQSRELGRSARETIEIAAALTFNNGFSGSFVGPDGVALFSASHPLVKAGGVQTNLASVAADLDFIPLQLALTDFETMKDSAGRLIHAPARRLVVAPANRFQAYELLKSGDRPDTANRATNSLKGAEDGLLEAYTWRYLTNPVSWFLLAEPQDTGLVWFWRKKPYTKGHFDFDTETAKTAMRYKKSHGWTDFYGTYGNAGV